MVGIGFHARAVLGTPDPAYGRDPPRADSSLPRISASDRVVTVKFRNLSRTAVCGNLYASARVRCLSPYAQSSYQLTRWPIECPTAIASLLPASVWQPRT